MKLKEFEEMTRTILAENRATFVEAYRKEGITDNSALLVRIPENIENGQANVEYFIISPKFNSPLYDKLPPELKKKLYDKEDKTYIIFIGWKGQVTSYILTKDLV